ncbi:MAG: hypothetical protein ABH854_04725 [Candidatus Diapherotrites archaeon]|nr:hypothetical protein [Candidatus Micrarchaeota archaeon]MBU1939370.1 hypothetical protein [Candidatus Micrarchaeota archaeon]
MSRLFITRPRYDKGTEYLYAWSEEVVKSAEGLGWVVDKSDGSKANAAEVQSKLRKNRADFVFFNGHGSKSQMYGHNHESILDVSSAHLLDGSIVFSRACNCVAGLGKSAVKKGCRAFIGYKGNFWIPRTHGRELTPLRDTAAKPVLEVSNQVPLSILKKCTVSESVSSAKRLAVKYILKLILSEEPHDRAALRALSQNDDCLIFEGNGDARAE